ncbi:MaoC family dehydratase [Shimia sp. R9_1]|uniref:MaoC family dehydratase n=1 Tax=unclassified Shimia TaxID=2630038 RepID=UPI001ADD1097|nr:MULTISPECIES: MaoC family dehydratase [unclassified Shimia]MBO9398929.1 MaoC family dehydratase [Shimia sp. R9_2]MBO9408888.1 MaoC family dehydratase [Shimia sp. R9_1]
MISRILKLEDGVGCEYGLSKWIHIDQAMIDAFAKATGDEQYIHTDPDAARDTPYGGTVAHGFLTLSLLSQMIADAVPRTEAESTGINYGFDRVRFVAPVKAGADIRGRFTLAKYAEPQPGVIETQWNVTVEIKGEDKPALVAQWKNLRFEKDATSFKKAG